MGILNGIGNFVNTGFNIYEGYKKEQDRQTESALKNWGSKAALWESTNPGQPMPESMLKDLYKVTGVQQPQDGQGQKQPGTQQPQPQPQGVIAQGLQPTGPVRSPLADLGQQVNGQQAPRPTMPSRPIYTLDPTGKLSNLGNVPMGADVEKLAQPKTVEYINPETDQRVDLPYGSAPPPGFRSADIYKQDRTDDRMAQTQSNIAARQDKSIAAITERMNNKPDTAAEDKQRRISIAQQEELGQPVSIQDKSWAKAYDKVQAKAAGQSGMVDNPDAGLTGEAALQNYTPEIQKLAKKMVAAEIPYPSSFALRDPQWKAVVQAATDLDPTWNASQHKIREQTRKSFTSGPDAKNITSINTLVGHLGSLDKSAKELGNSKIQLWNNLANRGITAFGDPKVAKFNMDLGAVESELAAVFKQTGATDQEIKAWRERISASQSPKQLQTAIHEAVELMGSRLGALKSKYEAGMGPFSQLPILSPRSRQTLEKLVGKESVEALEPKQETRPEAENKAGGEAAGKGGGSHAPEDIQAEMQRRGLM